MIRVERLSEPGILQRKREEWTERYLAKRGDRSGVRPESRQYAHQEIKEALAAMSHRKCFYCETRLDEDEFTVDHYVEVEEDPAMAFVWTNLYLACRGCQANLPSIARQDCLDPCSSEVDPADHLAFEDEIIRPHAASARGRQTIEKYKLDRGDLEMRRLRQWKRFSKELTIIRDHQIAENRKSITDSERERLLRYQAPEHPYSLMFRCVLATVSL